MTNYQPSYMKDAARVAGLFCLTAASVFAEPTKVLNSFESENDLHRWEINSGSPRLVSDQVTHGQRALEVTFDPTGKYGAAYMTANRRQDWTGFDALQLDVFNPNDLPLRGYVLVGDQAWTDKGRSYWNRHNGATTFAPGKTTWTIPVRGIYRGEAGSRNNDIKRNIDPDQIVRVDFGFGKTGDTGSIFIDNLRLVRGEKPDGVWAFDFGPPDQSGMIGWTTVAHDTQFDQAKGYGWGPQGGHPWNGAARDTTFGPALIRDFCEAGNYRFTAAVPSGRYRVSVIYENCGYWGGEQAKHRWRRIVVSGQEVWREDRPDGPAHALYRFEDVEPVGADMWDTYMKDELAKVASFETAAGSKGLTLHFEADVTWGSKVAALALHRADDEEAAEWLAKQMAELAEDFRGKAVCLDPKPPASTTPATWQDQNLCAWPVRLEDNITPGSVPPDDIPAPAELRLNAVAVRGETTTLGLAVRTASPFDGSVEYAATGDKAPLQSSVYSVRYNTGRGFGQIAYRIQAHTLRPASDIALSAEVTRQLILKVKIPDDAAPGVRTGELRLARKGGPVLRVPVRIDVRPVTLNRDTAFRFGFFGLMPPGLIPEEDRWNILEQTLRLLREYGMNQVCGGPSWTLKGWQNGKPVIDYGECDRFFDLVRQYGFTGPHNGYGGMRFGGLHDRYQKGKTGEKVERDSGLTYEEAMLRAWGAVAEHAREKRWPLIQYAMCDETRVREVAEGELAFMQLMGKVSGTYPELLRTSGSYSVHFRERPENRDNMLYWHQRFFEALDSSSLNSHDDTVMAEAQRLGKRVHIYNQDRTRYSFGMYQWSEYRKGVTARTQWHLNVLHGYQFFDLDGREPDTAMICYGREQIYPTIHFERCREGAEDFYLYNTLAKLVEQRRKDGKADAATEAAARLLEDATAKIAINERLQPDWFDPDSFNMEVIGAIERLQAQTR